MMNSKRFIISCIVYYKPFRVHNKLHSLQDFLDPKNYKSYDELKAKMNRVLGEGAPMTTAESISLDEEAPAKPMKEKPSKVVEEVVSNDEDDDTLSYFAKLAAE